MKLLPDSKSGSFQEQCSLELLKCIKLEKTSPGQGQVAWSQAKQTILSKKQNSRIIVADLDLTKSNLRGFDFSRCYIARVILRDAELSNSNCRQAIFRETDFSRAYLHKADLSLVDLRSCNLNFASPVTDILGVRPWLAEKIEIAQYRSDHSVDTKNWLLKQWYIVTSFGSSIRMLALTSLVVILLFAAIFYCAQNFVGQQTFSESLSPFQAIEYSTLVFLNSGPNVLTSNTWVLLAISFEVILGVIVLAVFIASLTRKLVIYR